MGGRTITRLVRNSAGGVTTVYVHADHLGSASASSGSTGHLFWREDHTPFGEARQDPVGNRDDEGFTGHIHDHAAGLTYMQARYYDPVIGRFLSNDPVGFAEGGAGYFNRYAYTFNDPVNLVDPDGAAAHPPYHDPLFVEGLVDQGVMTREQADVFHAQQTAGGMAVIAVGSLFVPGPEDVVVAGLVARKLGQGLRAIRGSGRSDGNERLVDIYEVPGSGTPSGKPYVGSGLTDGARRQFAGDGRDRTQSSLVRRVPESQRRPAEQQAMNDRGGVDNLDNKRNEVRRECWDGCGVSPPNQHH